MSSAPSSPPPRRAVLYWLPVLLWVGVMLFFSSAPDPYAAVGAQGTTVSDILGHLLGFTVFAVLAIRWLRFRMGKRGKRPILLGIALCLAYALFDELHQMPIPGRSFEWLDLATDAVGALVGAGIMAAIVRERRGNLETP